MLYSLEKQINDVDLFFCTRWDMDAVDKLPDYMKLCFLLLHNFIHELAFDVLKEHKLLIIKNLKKVVCTILHNLSI